MENTKDIQLNIHISHLFPAEIVETLLDGALTKFLLQSPDPARLRLWQERERERGNKREKGNRRGRERGGWLKTKSYHFSDHWWINWLKCGSEMVNWVRFILKEAQRETLEKKKRQDRRWNTWEERWKRGETRQEETEEKEVMPDALSPNCYPILSHKVTQIQNTNKIYKYKKYRYKSQIHIIQN